MYGLFFLSCIVLVAAVLLQPGKTDAGALFTSNVSSSAFAPRGTATVLSKVTIGAATTFMLSALLLALPALNGNVSVVSTTPEAANTESSANSNTADANANTAPADNSNGALIETPPAGNVANTANSSTASANVAPAANTNAKPAKSPAKK